MIKRIISFSLLYFVFSVSSVFGIGLHDELQGSGTNTHAQIDSHIGSTLNPHSVTVDQVGAEPAQTTASQAEMEAGTETAIRSMSPLRVKQAIDEHAGNASLWESTTLTSGRSLTSADFGKSIRCNFTNSENLPFPDGSGYDGAKIRLLLINTGGVRVVASGDDGFGRDDNLSIFLTSKYTVYDFEYVLATDRWVVDSYGDIEDGNLYLLTDTQSQYITDTQSQNITTTKG